LAEKEHESYLVDSQTETDGDMIVEEEAMEIIEDIGL
jgi:hypothetical protein